MSLMDISAETSRNPWPPARPGEAASAAPPVFHIVRDGEVSAHARRLAYARHVAQVSRQATAWAGLKLTAVLALFASAGITIVWAFLEIPNTALP